MSKHKNTQHHQEPKGNDKAGGGSQSAGDQQGHKVPGDTNNSLPEEMPAESSEKK